MNNKIVADELLSSLSKFRRDKWFKPAEEINFNKLSKKPWNLTMENRFKHQTKTYRCEDQDRLLREPHYRAIHAKS